MVKEPHHMNQGTADRRSMRERMGTPGPYTWQSAALRAAVVTDGHHQHRDPSPRTAIQDLRAYLNWMTTSQDSTWLAWAGLAERNIHAAIDHGVKSWTTGKGRPRAKQLIGSLAEKHYGGGHESITRSGLTGLLVCCHKQVAHMENLTGRYNSDPAPLESCWILTRSRYPSGGKSVTQDSSKPMTPDTHVPNARCAPSLPSMPSK